MLITICSVELWSILRIDTILIKLTGILCANVELPNKQQEKKTNRAANAEIRLNWRYSSMASFQRSTPSPNELYV